MTSGIHKEELSQVDRLLARIFVLVCGKIETHNFSQMTSVILHLELSQDDRLLALLFVLVSVLPFANFTER